MSCGCFSLVFSCVVVCETRDKVLELMDERAKLGLDPNQISVDFFRLVVPRSKRSKPKLDAIQAAIESNSALNRGPEHETCLTEARTDTGSESGAGGCRPEGNGSCDDDVFELTHKNLQPDFASPVTHHGQQAFSVSQLAPRGLGNTGTPGKLLKSTSWPLISPRRCIKRRHEFASNMFRRYNVGPMYKDQECGTSRRSNVSGSSRDELRIAHPANKDDGGLIRTGNKDRKETCPAKNADTNCFVELQGRINLPISSLSAFRFPPQYNTTPADFMSRQNQNLNSRNNSAAATPAAAAAVPAINTPDLQDGRRTHLLSEFSARILSATPTDEPLPGCQSRDFGADCNRIPALKNKFRPSNATDNNTGSSSSPQLQNKDNRSSISRGILLNVFTPGEIQNGGDYRRQNSMFADDGRGIQDGGIRSDNFYNLWSGVETSGFFKRGENCRTDKPEVAGSLFGEHDSDKIDNDSETNLLQFEPISDKEMKNIASCRGNDTSGIRSDRLFDIESRFVKLNDSPILFPGNSKWPPTIDPESNRPRVPRIPRKDRVYAAPYPTDIPLPVLSKWAYANGFRKQTPPDCIRRVKPSITKQDPDVAFDRTPPCNPTEMCSIKMEGPPETGDHWYDDPTISPKRYRNDMSEGLDERDDSCEGPDERDCSTRPVHSIQVHRQPRLFRFVKHRRRRYEKLPYQSVSDTYDGWVGVSGTIDGWTGDIDTIDGWAIESDTSDVTSSNGREATGGDTNDDDVTGNKFECGNAIGGSHDQSAST